MKRLINTIVLAATLSFMAACGGPMVNIGLHSNESLNPDRKGDPLPVVIRVYQLNDKGAFQSATFNQIWKNDESILGKTLLSRNELILNPSSKGEVEVDRHTEAKYLAIVAIFRNPIERKWRALEDISAGWVAKKLDLSESIDVSLVGNTLRITER